MIYLLTLQSPDLDQNISVFKQLLLFAVGVLIAWTPAFLLRNFVFKKPVPRWAGLLIAAVTLLLAMGVGILLTGRERAAIHATAAILAYLTVTQTKKEGEAKKEKEREAAE